MSSELKTPTTSFVEDLQSVLSEIENVAVYPSWIPAHGARLPCVTIIEVGGSMCLEVGVGQIADENVLGVLVPCRVQIDVWGRSVKTVRELVDKVGYALWSHRASFGDLRKGIRISAATWRSPGKGLSEKMYRQMLTCEAVYGMTRTVT